MIHRHYLSCLLVASTLSLPGHLSGQIDWTGPSGTVADPNSGNWSDAGNWDPSAPTSGDSTILRFTNTDSSNPAYTSTLDVGAAGSVFDVNQLIFNNNATSGNDVGITINAVDNRSIRLTGDNPSLIQNGSRRSEINAPVLFEPTSGSSIISGDGTGFLVIGSRGVLDAGNAGVLTKNGSGTLFFAWRNDGGANQAFIADRVVVNSGNFAFDARANIPTDVIVEVYGSGTYGSVTNGGGGYSVGGVIGDGSLRNQTNQTRTTAINVAEGETYQFNGSITDGRIANVQIGGQGRQVFGNGANITRNVTIGNTSQSSNFTFNDGHLGITGTVTGGGTTYVGNGGTLSGDGIWNRTLIVEAGGTLSPGNSTGTLTVGDTTLLDGFIYNWEFDNLDNSSDLIDILGTLDLTNGQTGTINLIGLNGNDLESFNGNFSLFTTLGIIGAGDGALSGWEVILNGDSDTGWFAAVSGNDIIIAIPEPSTYAAIFGSAALLLIFFRRRVKKE